MTMFSAKWKPQVDNCRKVRDESLNPEWLLAKEDLPPSDQHDITSFVDTCKALTAREQEITRSHGVDLVAQMAAGKLTAVETLTAFLKRAHVAHQLTNFATEFLTSEAMRDAADLDAHFKATGTLKGPLHGLPISTKEHIGHEGRIAHSAYVAWTGNVATEDALLVRLAKEAGAVFHIRTNEPQSVMHFDCSNHIYGTTVNPYNRKLTCGGSSGGEGVSLGLRCAALGIGTDLGGSVRVPAAFCGAFGLRTTALRNPYKGVHLPGAGQESVRCVMSPLANSAEDLDLFQQAVIDSEPWEEETSLVPLPWRKLEPVVPEKITVGVIWDDGLVHPHPPVTRALKHAVQRLKDAGITVVDFEPFNHEEGWELLKPLYFPDAAFTQKSLLDLGGEEYAPLTTGVLSVARPEPLTILENWELNARRDAYRDGYHRVMKERKVDFLLSPAYVGVAAELHTAEYILYTGIWNLVDLPSATFPTGFKADPSVDVVEADYKPRSADDEREYKRYIPDNYAGAPIGLQITGKHMRDEEMVQAVALISKLVRATTTAS